MINKKKLDDIWWDIQTWYYVVCDRIKLPFRWMQYRTTQRYHIINTKLTPGYYEIDDRILHANFSVLVDYVESELAWTYYLWNKKEKNLSHPVPFWRRKFTEFRSKEYGLAAIDWDINESSWEPQKEKGKKVLELYKWWTEIRPNREDPWVKVNKVSEEESMDEIFTHTPNGDGTYTVEMKPLSARYRKALQVANNKEREQYEEDTRMLVKLMKIRETLYT